MPKKERLDLQLIKMKLAASRQQARGLIMSGRVLVNGLLVEKAGAAVTDADKIRIKGGQATTYVSRGGHKLAAALEQLNVRVDGLICMDVGASTGGFTDCLLQHGAARVYAVDVGYGQLAWPLRQDPRVVVIERTNIRHMTRGRIAERVDLATVDVSFISLKIVIPAVMDFLKPPARIVALIKPQFEVGKGRVGKGGVVRDPDVRDTVVHDLIRHFTEMGFSCSSALPSPILGPKGNQEFLVYLIRQDFD